MNWALASRTVIALLIVSIVGVACIGAKDDNLIRHEVLRFDVTAEPLEFDFGSGKQSTGEITVSLNDRGKNIVEFDIENSTARLDVLLDVEAPALSTLSMVFPPLRIQENGPILWGVSDEGVVDFWWAPEGGSVVGRHPLFGGAVVHAKQKAPACNPNPCPGWIVGPVSPPSARVPFPESYSPFPPQETEQYREEMELPDGYRPLESEEAAALIGESAFSYSMAFSGLLRLEAQGADIVFEGEEGHIELQPADR